MRGPNLIPSLPQTIDPLAPGPHGRYDDHLVSVLCAESPWGRAKPLGGRAANAGLVVRTDHFCLTERGRRIEVTHWLSPDELDNDVAGLLAEELFAPGWLSGVEIFERVFTGVVRSCVDDPLLAWCTFYGNTLARIRQCWRPPGAAGREHTTIGQLAPVYAHALELIPAGHVLDLGSCFGFLPLLLAERPDNTVTASDLSGGSMGLLSAVAAARGLQVTTLVCDAARIPVPDGWANTVSVIHLLEHVSPDQGRAVIGEALRVARRQVVVAVPVEDEPSAAFGHVRTFDLRQLGELGDLAGHRGRVHEHHGGWLVLTAG